MPWRLSTDSPQRRAMLNTVTRTRCACGLTRITHLQYTPEIGSANSWKRKNVSNEETSSEIFDESQRG